MAFQQTLVRLKKLQSEQLAQYFLFQTLQSMLPYHEYQLRKMAPPQVLKHDAPLTNYQQRQHHDGQLVT